MDPIMLSILEDLTNEDIRQKYIQYVKGLLDEQLPDNEPTIVTTIESSNESTEETEGAPKSDWPVIAASGEENTATEEKQDDKEKPCCICSYKRYGLMMKCSNNDCETKWFHFKCVGVSKTPKGNWFCPSCRGSNPSIRKGEELEMSGNEPIIIDLESSDESSEETEGIPKCGRPVIPSSGEEKSRTEGKLKEKQDDKEKPYCICSYKSYGRMIMCSNNDCDTQWFHYKCVKVSKAPKGDWFCPSCRGSNPSIRKGEELEMSGNEPIIINLDSTDESSEETEGIPKSDYIVILDSEEENSATEEKQDDKEKPYCICSYKSYGRMIMCSNDDCDTKWFHYKCVKVSKASKGDWFCPRCRGSKPSKRKGDEDESWTKAKKPRKRRSHN